MDKLVNVATPLTAATVLVPASAPDDGLVPSAAVTLALLVVTVLPNWSWMRTVGAGEIDCAAAVAVGCTPKATFAADAAATVTVADPVFVVSLVSATDTFWLPAVVSVEVKVCEPLSPPTYSSARRRTPALPTASERTGRRTTGRLTHLSFRDMNAPSGPSVPHPTERVSRRQPRAGHRSPRRVS
jgi:hypothetical protein